jgi:tight adherence protein B
VIFELLLGLVAGGLALALILVVHGALERRRLEAELRLQGPSSETTGALSSPATSDSAPPGLLARLDAAFEQAVDRSGLQDVSPAGVLAVMCLSAIGLAASAFLWTENLGLTAVALAIGFAVPFTVILFLQARYRRQLQEQLPDAFYLMARSLRAGLPVEQAIETYSQQGPKPLANELARCAAQLRLGVSLPNALAATSRRIKLLDFNVFVSTIVLYMQTGGNLALLLDRLASSVRDRNQYRGHFLAATAQARIVAIFTAAVGPALLLYYAIAEPEHIQAFFQSVTGWLVLVGALALEVVGAIWAWNMLKVDY